MRRTTCGACGYDDLHLFLDLGLSPIADAYTSAADERSERHPLQLTVCTGCWLVQLLEVVDQKTLFGTGYSFYSSASPPLSAYHAEYARGVLAAHRDIARRLTVEIGCNDGDALRHFTENGCTTIGVDPAGGPVEVARGRGLNVLQEPFTANVADRIVDEHGRAGVVLANHVLAHVESVADVLDGISRLLDDESGVAFVEVQYLPDLLTNNAFDLVYHEHRNFFTLSSLEKAASCWGLHVVDARLTDRQGGSLRVTLRRTRGGTSSSVAAVKATETWLHDRGAYGGVQGRTDRIAQRLRATLHDELSVGSRIIGFGAPAKATTLLNFCGIDSRWFKHVIDSTPAKQGRFIPGTGIQIVPPEEVDLREYDLAVLHSWNYSSVIIRNNSGFTDQGGRWLLPIPAPLIL
jgi:C-methyltransferase C-terminal domain/Methyltransferase domain/Putative zinc binding domain